MHPIVNTHQSEAWNGYEGIHWAEHSDRWDAVVGAVNDDLLRAAAIDRQTRVLDIGCGTGQTTQMAARRARHGHARGIDLSAPMLARARAAAAAEGITNVGFDQGDAQVFPFPPGEFDVAISRGGVVFFADPVAAFANIASALRPEGRLVFVCPRDMHLNDWFMVPTTALLGHQPAPNTSTAYEPGMFSLADPTRINDVLTRAGFHNVTTNPIYTPMVYGRDAADAAAFILSTGPAQHHLRGTDQTSLDQARESITAALRPHEQPDAVRLRGAWWLVTATHPKTTNAATSSPAAARPQP